VQAVVFVAIFSALLLVFSFFGRLLIATRVLATAQIIQDISRVAIDTIFHLRRGCAPRGLWRVNINIY